MHLSSELHIVYLSLSPPLPPSSALPLNLSPGGRREGGMEGGMTYSREGEVYMVISFYLNLFN